MILSLVKRMKAPSTLLLVAGALSQAKQVPRPCPPEWPTRLGGCPARCLCPRAEFYPYGGSSGGTATAFGVWDWCWFL